MADKSHCAICRLNLGGINQHFGTRNPKSDKANIVETQTTTQNYKLFNNIAG